jgi:hypothetical protein
MVKTAWSKQHGQISMVYHSYRKRKRKTWFISLAIERERERLGLGLGVSLSIAIAIVYVVDPQALLEDSTCPTFELYKKRKFLFIPYYAFTFSQSHSSHQ